MTDPQPLFWHRLPAGLGRLLLGSLAAMTVLGALVGGLALVAQRQGDPSGVNYSVTMHVLAMLSVAVLAVGVAVGLIRHGQTLFAGLVLIGSAAGPMTLVAVPVRASLVDTSSFGDTKLWWRMVVAGSLLVLLSAWSVWASRCLKKQGNVKTARDSSTPFSWLMPVVLFLVVSAVGLVTYSQSAHQTNLPVTRAIVGWALLAAGIVVVTTLSRTAWTSLVALFAVGAMLGLIFLAYSRIGGWPGVAGWEFDGMESPIVTSVPSTQTLLAAPVVGALAWMVRLAGLRALRPRLRRAALAD